jgi:restriction system protein
MNQSINTQHAICINWMAPLMTVIKDNGGSSTAQEAIKGVAVKMKLSDEILTERYEKSGLLKFNNQVYWAKQYLAWEGYITVSKRGVWSLTDKGFAVAMDYDDALALFNKWVRIHGESRKSKKTDKKGHTTDIVIADQTAEAESDEDGLLPLIDVLKQTTPTGFEYLCGRLLREYDFEDIQITKHSHDGGIDGTAILKLNPFVNMSVYFQCKKYDGTIPIGQVREFIGVLESEKRGVDKGLFITTGALPSSAYELERNNTKLELIDGEKLVSMFERVELGVTPRTVYDVDLTFFAKYMKAQLEESV